MDKIGDLCLWSKHAPLGQQTQNLLDDYCRPGPDILQDNCFLRGRQPPRTLLPRSLRKDTHAARIRLALPEKAPTPTTTIFARGALETVNPSSGFLPTSSWKTNLHLLARHSLRRPTTDTSQKASLCVFRSRLIQSQLPPRPQPAYRWTLPSTGKSHSHRAQARSALHHCKSAGEHISPRRTTTTNHGRVHGRCLEAAFYRERSRVSLLKDFVFMLC